MASGQEGFNGSLSIRQKVEAALTGMEQLDPDPFVAMFAEDGRTEMAGANEATVGRAAIAARVEVMRGFQELRRLWAPRLYVDEQSNVVTVEMETLVRPAAEAPAMIVTQAVIIEFDHGLAKRWTEYRGVRPALENEDR